MIVSCLSLLSRTRSFLLSLLHHCQYATVGPNLVAGDTYIIVITLYDDWGEIITADQLKIAACSVLSFDRCVCLYMDLYLLSRALGMCKGCVSVRALRAQRPKVDSMVLFCLMCASVCVYVFVFPSCV